MMMEIGADEVPRFESPELPQRKHVAMAIQQYSRLVIRFGSVCASVFDGFHTKRGNASLLTIR